MICRIWPGKENTISFLLCRTNFETVLILLFVGTFFSKYLLTFNTIQRSQVGFFFGKERLLKEKVQHFNQYQLSINLLYLELYIFKLLFYEMLVSLKLYEMEYFITLDTLLGLTSKFFSLKLEVISFQSNKLRFVKILELHIFSFFCV